MTQTFPVNCIIVPTPFELVTMSKFMICVYPGKAIEFLKIKWTMLIKDMVIDSNAPSMQALESTDIYDTNYSWQLHHCSANLWRRRSLLGSLWCVQKSDLNFIEYYDPKLYWKKVCRLKSTSKQSRQLADVYDKALLATTSLFQQPLNWLPKPVWSDVYQKK